MDRRRVHENCPSLNERGDKIVNELHHPEAEPNTRIVILTSEKVNEEEIRRNDRYENVYFVYGDPTIHSSLEKGANAHLAKCVVILVDDKCPDPDGKTALIALAIEKLAKNKGLPSPRILAEVKNHRKIEHLIDAGVDEWICATDYGLGILAQCVFSPKLTEVYHQLLTFGEETCEIYFIPPDKIPHTLYGKTFEEIADFFNKNRDADNPSILLGVKREKKIILNPRRGKDEFDKLKKDDSLIVLAYTWPKINFKEK
ncbi:MAG: NAD-binding protein [candidate division WOR-3 bacterium]